KGLLLRGCVSGLCAKSGAIGGRNRCAVCVSSCGGTCCAVCWLRGSRGSFANSRRRSAGSTAPLLLRSRRLGRLFSWGRYPLTLKGSLAAQVLPSRVPALQTIRWLSGCHGSFGV